MTDPRKTLEAVRALTAPDREVADDVLRCFGWEHHHCPPIGYGDENASNWDRLASGWLSPFGDWFYDQDGDQPNPLASIDAAAALMPEGYSVQININLYGTRKCYVTFWPEGDPLSVQEEVAFDESAARTAAALAAKITEGEK